MSPSNERTGNALLATQALALVGHTMREARHKWTFVVLFVLTSLFLFLLATLVNVDIVEGTIASARLFGTFDLDVGEQSIQIRDAVTVLQAILVGFVSSFGLVLALFVTGSIVPSTLTPGWVDLLASQPTPRWMLVLGRAIGALLVVGIALAYLFGGAWAILTWKTGFGNPRFLLAGAIILFSFAACYAGMVLVGVLTRSSPISIITGVGLWLVGQILYPLHNYDEQWTSAFSAGWPRTLASAITETLYWSLPKTAELTGRSIDAAQAESVSLVPVLSSLPFTVGCLALACWLFARRDT